MPHLTDTVRQLQLTSRLLAVLGDASPLVRMELVVAFSVQVCAQPAVFRELMLSSSEQPEPLPSNGSGVRSGEQPESQSTLTDDLTELSLDSTDSMNSLHEHSAFDEDPLDALAASVHRFPAAADANTLRRLSKKLGSALLRALHVLKEDPYPPLQRMSVELLAQSGSCSPPQRALPPPRPNTAFHSPFHGPFHSPLP